MGFLVFPVVVLALQGGVGGGALPPLLDGGEACIAASAEEKKVKALLDRRNLAEQWMNEQRAILKDLGNEFTNEGC